jgi:hypothetical protein
MVLLDDAVYKETKKIALGKAKRSLILIELSDWLMNMYSVKVLNFEFNKLIGSSSDKYRLCIIMKNTEDYQKMHVSNFEFNPEYQSQIAGEFQTLAAKYRFATAEQLRDLFVSYNDFSEEAKTEANWKAIDRFKWVVKFKYPAVWKVISMFSSTVVFYYGNSDIAPNEQNGLSEKIIGDYYSVLKKYDDLNYFTRENIQVKFDSKENVDKNYEGSLFYYTR